MIAHGPVQCRSNENSRGNVSGFLFAADANARSAARAIYNERCITSDVLQAMYYKRCIADCRAHCIQWPVIVSGLTGVPAGASQTPTKGVSFIEEGVEDSAARGDGVNDS